MSCDRSVETGGALLAVQPIFVSIRFMKQADSHPDFCLISEVEKKTKKEISTAAVPGSYPNICHSSRPALLVPHEKLSAMHPLY